MHDAVRRWVRRHLPEQQRFVVEFGALDINGGILDLLDCDRYAGVDIQDGPGVDVIADAATWTPDDEPDVVLCLEVFEHAREWPQIIANAHRVLAPGGTFIATAACLGRAPHSARRESPPDPDEHYENIDPADLEGELYAAGFGDIWVDVAWHDVRCVARKAG